MVSASVLPPNPKRNQSSRCILELEPSRFAPLLSVNLSPAPVDRCYRAEGVAVAKRFIVAFITFIGLIFPAAFALALLVAPAQPLEQPGCGRDRAGAFANVTTLEARVKRLGIERGSETCAATRLYFLEVVKTRAVTALCKNGPELERELGQLDAEVETINNAIAASCG